MKEALKRIYKCIECNKEEASEGVLYCDTCESKYILYTRELKKKPIRNNKK
jgi:transcription elongation factor Elf1